MSKLLQIIHELEYNDLMKNNFLPKEKIPNIVKALCGADWFEINNARFSKDQEYNEFIINKLIEFTCSINDFYLNKEIEGILKSNEKIDSQKKKIEKESGENTEFDAGKRYSEVSQGLSLK